MMKPKSAKAKGRRLQNEVAQDIAATLMVPEEGVRGAIMGESGCDIKLAYTLRTEFPFSVECKNVERLNIWEALAQAEKNAVPGTMPVVVIRRNNIKPWAVIPWTLFLELIKNGLLRGRK